MSRLRHLIYVPLVAGAIALSSSSTSIQDTSPLASKQEYLRPYIAAQEAKEKRFLKWLETVSNDYAPPTTIEEDIIDSMYLPFKANVPSLKQADLIIFGDLHGYMHVKLNHLLDRMVTNNDEILFEQSTDSGMDIDLRLLADENMPKYDEAADVFQRLDLLSKHVSHLGYKMDLMKAFSPEKKMFGSSLIHDGRGVFKAIDSPKDVKKLTLYSFVEGPMLYDACNKMNSNETLHDFQSWMIYDALKLTEKGSKDGLNDVIAYCNGFNSRMESAVRQRQSTIVKNIVNSVRDNNPKKRQFLVIGSLHIDDELLGSLEKERLGYVAFVPDNEKVLKFSSRDEKPVENDEEMMRKANASYLEEKLAPWYVREKVADGSPNYSGKYDGLADIVMRRK